MSRYIDTVMDKTGSVVMNRTSVTLQRLLSIFVQFTNRLKLAARIKNERRVLAALSDEMLQDIGIDSLAATLESDRSFLDIPAQRKSGTMG